MKKIYKTNYPSPIGNLEITSDGEAILKISFKKPKQTRNDNLKIFKTTIQWFEDYFEGKNPEITFPLKPDGTDFRVKVWEILKKIPYGETITYGEIASLISPTMSAQAVGGAIGANPIAIIIPCHRVIGKNGKLTGYAAGLDKKIELLKIEKILPGDYSE